MVSTTFKTSCRHPQVSGEPAYYLVCETTHKCNYGFHALPKTSDAARQRGGSNTTFEGITVGNVDERFMEAGMRAAVPDSDEQWPAATSVLEAGEQAQKNAYTKLAFSFKAESTNDITMMLLAQAITTIANLYPANAVDKRVPRGISEDVMADLAPHCA